MAIYTIEDLRQQMVEAGRATEQASDAELVTKYGELIGENPFELANYFGVETGADSSAFGAGISAGADTLQSLGYSALAAGSRALGADDASESFMRSAEAEQYEAFLTGKPEYERIEDQDSLGDYLGYGAYQIGKQLPIMGGITAASLATGGVGAAAGLGLRTGMAIGGVGTGYGVGVGSLYQSAYEAEQQGTPVNMGEVFAKAIPYAAAEALLPTALARTVTGTGMRPAAATRLGAGAQAGLGGVVTEGATELAQTELEISMNPYLSEEEKFSQRLNAAVAGGVSGGAISGGVGLIAGPRKTGTEEKDLASTQPKEETFAPSPKQQEEFDLGRPPVLEGEMQDELGTPDTGLVDTDVAEVDPYIEQRREKEEFEAQREREKLNKATTPPIEQIELVDDGTPQLQLDFTDAGEVSTINSELASFDETLKEAIAGRKQVPVGRRKVEEKKLAVVQTELDKVNEQLAAIRSVGFGRKNKKAKIARAKALEASKKALEAKRDEIQGKLDVVDAGKQASEKRKELRKATKAYTKGVAFNELTTEQQALLRQASPTIAFNNPEQTATEVEQIEEVAPTQEAEQVELTSEVVEQEKSVPVTPAEDTDVDAEVTEAELSALYNELNAEISSESGEATGKVTVPQSVAYGIMRMLRDPSLLNEPTKIKKNAVAIVPGTAREIDQEATELYGERIARAYTLMTQIARAAQQMSNAQGNVFKGRSAEIERKEETVEKNARLYARRRAKLKPMMDELVEILGSQKNVEAVIAMHKLRNGKVKSARANSSRFDKANAYFNKKGEPMVNQLDFDKILDLNLSSTFAEYKDTSLEETDTVQRRPVRVGKERVGDNKLKQAIARGGLLGVIKEYGSYKGKATPYQITLASAIRYALERVENATGTPTNVVLIPREEGVNPTYDPNTNTVTLFEDSPAEEVLHETLHAVTQAYVVNNPTAQEVVELSRSLDELFAAVENGGINNINMPQEYKAKAEEVVNLLARLRSEGKESDAILELMAYGSTLRDFKALLKGIKSNPSTKTVDWQTMIQRVWDKIVSLMASLMGVENTVANNVIDNTIYILQKQSDVESTPELATEGNVLNMAILDGTSDANPKDQDGEYVEDSYYVSKARNKQYLSALTKPFFEMIRYQKGVEVTDEKLSQLAQYIRQNMPGLERSISYFNSRFSIPKVVSEMMDRFKVNKNTGYQRMETLASMVERFPKDKVLDIMDAFDDPEMKSLDKYDDAKKLKELVSSISAFLDAYIAEAPKDVQDHFANNNFAESLIYVAEQNAVSSHTIGMRKIADQIKSQGETIDSQSLEDMMDLMEMDTNGDLVADGDFYEVIIKPSVGAPYRQFVAKSVYERLQGKLPIYDGSYTVDNNTNWKMGGKTKSGGRTFTKRVNLKEAYDTNKAEQLATALRNTMGGLANYYASKNFIKSLMTTENIVFDDIESLNAYLVESGAQPLTQESLHGIADDGKIITTEQAKDMRLKHATRSSTQYVRVSGSVDVWGDLAGKIIPGSVWHAMQDMSDRKPLVNSRAYNNTLRLFKKAKTIYNPGTHITNVASNVTLAMMHDIPLSTIAEAAKVMYLYEVSPQKLTDTQLQVMSEFMNSGAMLGNYSSVEVKNVLSKATAKHLTDKGDESVMTRVTSLLNMEKDKGEAAAQLAKRSGDVVKRGDEIVTELYAAEDNMFRLAAFIKEVGNQQLRTGNKVPTAENFTEAGNFARKAFLDYDIDAPAVKMARQTAFPFISWTYAVIPVLGRIMVNQPWKVANVLTAYMLLDMATSALAGDDDEMRKLGPEKLDETIFGIPGLRTHIRLPFLGDENNPVYYRLGDYVPLATTVKGIPNGFMGLDWFPGGFTPGGPFLSGIVAALGGVDTYTGKSISDEAVSGGEDFLNRATYITDLFLPPAVSSRTREKIGDALSGNVNFAGQPSDIADVLVARVAGLKVVEFDTLSEAKARQIRKSAAYRKYNSAIAKARREEARKGYPDYEALNQEILELRQEMVDEYNKIFKLEDE